MKCNPSLPDDARLHTSLVCRVVVVVSVRVRVRWEMWKW